MQKGPVERSVQREAGKPPSVQEKLPQPSQTAVIVKAPEQRPMVRLLRRSIDECRCQEMAAPGPGEASGRS